MLRYKTKTRHVKTARRAAQASYTTKASLVG